MPKHELDPEKRAFIMDRVKALDPVRSRLALLLGAVAMVPGVFMMLVGFNIIHLVSRSGHLPLTIFVAFGATVFLGGLSAFLRGLGLSPKSWLNGLLGIGVWSAMAAPFIWLLFIDKQISDSTKLVFKAMFGVMIFLFLIFFFARFIPGVRVIGNKGPRAIERSNKGWEDD